MAEAQQESGFQPDAKAATSSATGLYQFTDATWLDMVRLHGAQHGVGQLAEQITTNAAGHSVVADPSARAHILSLRKDPALSASLAAELTKSNKDEVEKALGRPASGADLYLAHFLGAGGATEILKAIQQNGSKPAAELLPEAAAANRSVFYDPQSGAPRTVSDIYRSLAARVEKNAADYSPSSAGAAAASSGETAPSSWSPGATVLGHLPGTQIASVFNTMFLTALKLLGGSNGAQSDFSALGAASPSSSHHHRDDRTT
jgi:hypothetical protein